MQQPIPIVDTELQALDDDFNAHRFVEVNHLEMLDNVIVRVNQGPGSLDLPLNENAKSVLEKFAGVPGTYLNKIQDIELVKLNWNYWLGQQNERGEVKALKAVIKDDMVVGWTRRGWQEIPPSHVVMACAEGLPGAQFERPPLSNGCQLNFNLTAPQLVYEAPSGIRSDLHHFSVLINYNALGIEIPEVRVQGHRQVCGNLMNAYCGVSGKQFQVYSSTRDQMIERFREFTRKGAEFIQMTFVPQIEKTLRIEYKDVANDLTDFLNKHRVPQSIQALVFECLEIENLGGTMYHVSNALTRAANSDRCPENWREPLRWLAGELTMNHTDEKSPDRCPTCRHVVPPGTVMA